MLYRIHPLYNPAQTSQVETWDGKVVKTTPYLVWMRGMDIAEVVAYCELHGYVWRPVHEAYRASNLSDRYQIPKEKPLFLPS